MNKNKIFEKIKIKDTEFSNRIVVSPMCQYSAIDGLMNDWHFQHLSQFGFSGAGLVMIESTAVENTGRITHNCTGIYDDDCLSSIKAVMEKVKALKLSEIAENTSNILASKIDYFLVKEVHLTSNKTHKKLLQKTFKKVITPDIGGHGKTASKTFKQEIKIINSDKCRTLKKEQFLKIQGALEALTAVQENSKGVSKIGDA